LRERISVPGKAEDADGLSSIQDITKPDAYKTPRKAASDYPASSMHNIHNFQANVHAVSEFPACRCAGLPQQVSPRFFILRQKKRLRNLSGCPAQCEKELAAPLRTLSFGNPSHAGGSSVIGFCRDFVCVFIDFPCPAVLQSA
jgi:hypothetical protein